MRLPRNRWFEVLNGKTILKFGKHKGDYLDDLLGHEQGVWYLKMMLREFEDLPADIRTFIETAIEEGEDPVSAEQKREEEQSPSQVVSTIDALKAKAKEKLKAEKGKEEAKTVAKVLQKRKDESEW